MSDSLQPVEISLPEKPTAATIQVFFDADCPLCSREVSWMERRAAARRSAGRDPGRLEFIDIAAPDFDPSETGRSLDELMGSLHARTPDGAWLTGMDVIRAMYSEVGLGRWLGPTTWPVLSPVFDLLYRGFARVRPYLQNGKTAEATCSDRCAAPHAPRAQQAHRAKNS